MQRSALNRGDEDTKGVLSKHTPGGLQEMLVVHEGVYRAVPLRHVAYRIVTLRSVAFRTVPPPYAVCYLEPGRVCGGTHETPKASQAPQKSERPAALPISE
jgi:hypothetical protein